MIKVAKVKAKGFADNIADCVKKNFDAINCDKFILDIENNSNANKTQICKAFVSNIKNAKEKTLNEINAQFANFTNEILAKDFFKNAKNKIKSIENIANDINSHITQLKDLVKKSKTIPSIEKIDKICTLKNDLITNIKSFSSICEYIQNNPTTKSLSPMIKKKIDTHKKMKTSMYNIRKVNEPSPNKNYNTIANSTDFSIDTSMRSTSEINEIRELKNQVSTLKDENAKLTNEISTLNSQLKEKIESYISTLNTSQQKENYANETNSTLSSLRDQLRNSQREYKELKEIYNSDIESKSLIEAALKREIVDSRKQNEMQISQLKETIAMKEKEMNDLKEHYQNEEIAILTQIKENNKKNIQQLKSLYDANIAAKENIIEKQNAMLQKMKIENETNAKRDKYKEDSESDNESELLKEEIEKISKEKNEIESRYEMLSNEYSQYKTNCIKNEQEFEIVKITKQKIEDEFTKCKNELIQQKELFDKLNNEIYIVKETKNKLEKENELLRSEIVEGNKNKANKENEVLNQNEKLSSLNKNLNEQIEKLKNENLNLSSQHKNCNTTIENLKNENTNLKTENEKIKTSYNIAHTKFTAEIENLKSMNDKYQKEIFNSQKKMLLLEQTGNEYKQQLDTLQSKINKSSHTKFANVQSFALVSHPKQKIIKISNQHSFAYNKTKKEIQLQITYQSANITYIHQQKKNYFSIHPQENISFIRVYAQKEKESEIVTQIEVKENVLEYAKCTDFAIIYTNKKQKNEQIENCSITYSAIYTSKPFSDLSQSNIITEMTFNSKKPQTANLIVKLTNKYEYISKKRSEYEDKIKKLTKEVNDLKAKLEEEEEEEDEEEEEENEEDEEEEDDEEDDDSHRKHKKNKKNNPKDELKKFQNENKKLTTTLKNIQTENQTLHKRLDEVEATMQQEKDEFVGMLRVAFEKLLLEVQLTNKSKEFVTCILQMLCYTDDEIFEIYNSLGKKKGIFGIFR